MPWRQVDPMTERLRFIRDARNRVATFADLCRLYGIARVTGYKWLPRAEQSGIDYLPPASSQLGPAEAAQIAAAPGPPVGEGTRPLARPEHRGRTAPPERTYDPATATPLSRASGAAAHPDDRPECDLDGGLQGPVQAGGRGILLSAHGAGWVQPLPAHLPGAPWDHLRRVPAGVYPALPGIRPARDSAHRQRGALCHRGPGPALAAQRVVDPAGDLPRAHRAGPSRTERPARTDAPDAQAGHRAPPGPHGPEPAAAIRCLPGGVQPGPAPRSA